MLKYSDQIQNSVAGREIKAAWFWWLRELESVFGDLSARFAKSRDEEFHAVFDPDALSEEPERHLLTSDPETWARCVAKLDETRALERGITVFVPLSLCLVRTSTYPRVPPHELEQMIALELSSKTPFSFENAHWTWTKGQGEDIDVILVKKHTLDLLKEQALEAGLLLKEIRPDCPGEPTRPFEKFPTPYSRKKQRLRKIGLGLCLAAVTLSATAYAHTLTVKKQALQELQDSIGVARQEASVLNRNTQAYETKMQARNDLLAFKNERTSIVETWARLTQKLPKSVWLTELTIEANGGAIVGFTPNAASLIELLEQDATIMDVSFSTAVRIDPLTKAERFDIRFSRETPP
ncbi:PilN domain-containing protein [Roseibium alexandrii]